jgi:hypothetical protein
MTAPRKKKRGPGRPFAKEPQSSRIAFAVTPEGHARYRRAADSAGMKLGAWLKAIADAAS